MSNAYYKKLLLGPNVVHVTVRDFLRDAASYFQYLEDFPLVEEQLFANKGVVVTGYKTKMRAATLQGLASHMGISTSKLRSYRTTRGEAFAEAMEKVDQLIYLQKFEGAAAGLLNATVVSRDLGLTDKQEIETSGPAGQPVKLELAPMQKGTYLPPLEKN